MNFKLKQLGQGIALASLLAAGGMVHGANDGSLGTSSTGDLDVTVTIAPLVRITGLSDVEFTFDGGDENLENTQNICVYSNAGSNYSLTATSLNSDNGFALVSGSLEVAYSVAVNGSSLTSGSAADFGDANTVDQLCGGTGATALQISIDNAALQAAASGTYTDLLTLTVEPN